MGSQSARFNRSVEELREVVEGHEAALEKLDVMLRVLARRLGLEVKFVPQQSGKVLVEYVPCFTELTPSPASVSEAGVEGEAATDHDPIKA